MRDGCVSVHPNEQNLITGLGMKTSSATGTPDTAISSSTPDNLSRGFWPAGPRTRDHKNKAFDKGVR